MFFLGRQHATLKIRGAVLGRHVGHDSCCCSAVSQPANGVLKLVSAIGRCCISFGMACWARSLLLFGGFATLPRSIFTRLRHFTYHCVVGQAFPFGFACLHCIRPPGRVDSTLVPHVGHEIELGRLTTPFLTRNCLPQCPWTCTFPSRTVLLTVAWQCGHL